MKAVVLVGHPKASSKELAIPDKERPLRKRPKNDLKLMKAVLPQPQIKP